MVWTDFGSSSVPFARPVRCSLISSFPLHLRLVARTLFCCLCSCAAHARCWPLLFFFLCPFCYCPICTHKCLIAHSSRGCVTRSSLAQIPLTCSMGCSPGLVSTALCDPGKGTQQCGNICKVRKENSASGRSLRLTQSLNCAHNISTHAIGIALTALASDSIKRSRPSATASASSTATAKSLLCSAPPSSSPVPHGWCILEEASRFRGCP